MSFGTWPRGFAQDEIRWPLVRSKDLVHLNYGRALTARARREGAVKVYGTNGPCGWHDSTLTPGPTVILGRKGMGPLGVEWSSDPVWVIDTAYYVTSNHKDLDLKYFYYLIKYIGLNHLKDGTSNPSLSRDTFGLQLFPLPPHPDQCRIAQVLRTLDDKIESNRRMNETLEHVVATLYQSMLETSNRDSAVAPRSRSVYEIADVIYGAPFASVHFNKECHGEPLIRIRDLRDETPEVFTTETHINGYRVRRGDLVVGMDGEFRAYMWGGPEGWLNQRVCVFRPKAGFSAAFVSESIKEPLRQVELTETATTVIHLGKSDIDRFAVPIPDVSQLGTFNRAAQPCLDRVVANKQESRTLAQLRDTLLPKLLSGELRVRDAEKEVAKAV